MMSRHEALRRIAIDIVAESQPCTANQLVAGLREAGASHAEANRTLFELIRDGPVRRTFFGDLYLDRHPGISLGKFVVYVVFMAPIVAFIAWIFYQLFWGASADPPPGFLGAG
jgi:hypothetical protein